MAVAVGAFHSMVVKQDDSMVLIGMLMLWFGRCVRDHSFSWFDPCVCARGLFGRCLCVHSLVDWNARARGLVLVLWSV